MATKRSKSSCSEKGDSLGHNIQNLPSPPVTPKKRRYSTYSELLASFSPRKQPVSELDGCIPGNSNSCADIITVEKEVIEKSFSTYCISKSNKSEHASLMTNKDCSSQDKGRSKNDNTKPLTRGHREDTNRLDNASYSLRITENEQTSVIWRRVSAFVKIKSDNFLLARKAEFLPLLPSANYIADIVQEEERTGVSDCIAKYEEVRQPRGVLASMKPYQVDGLSFLVHMFRNCASCILGDEMGLGKTLQTLALFQFLKESYVDNSEKGIRGFTLIICPLSVLDSWVKESHKWTPGLRVVQLHGTADQRRILKADLLKKMKDKSRHNLGNLKHDTHVPHAPFSGYDLIITTYEAFVSEQKWLKSTFIWRYVVLDEGHRIKNSETALSKALLNLKAEHRLLLTGTPLHNNLLESWSLLHWLYPDVFTRNTAELFKSSFDLGKGSVCTSFLDSVNKLLKVIMLRRLKDDLEVDISLPSKSEILLFVPLTTMQRIWYTSLLTSSHDTISIFQDVEIGVGCMKPTGCCKHHKSGEEDSLNSSLTESNHVSRQSNINSINKSQTSQKYSRISRQMLMNLVLQLRKCCIHPYLIQGAQPDPYETGQHVIRVSGKFIVLEKLLIDIVGQRREKVLIFSGFTSVLDLCEELINQISNKEKRMNYLRLDGNTGRARRNLHIRLFQNFDFSVMLLTTRAGGLGITLTAANNVIFLDEDWNPQITLQAEGRAHRIGQTRPVTTYKLCTQGTVEEQMRGRIQKKLYLSTRVTSTATSNGQIPGLPSPDNNIGDKRKYDNISDFNESQLKALVRGGAQLLVHPEIDVDELLSWDLATTIHRCKSQAIDDFSDSQRDFTKAEEEKWLSTMERIQCAIFEGKRHQRAQKSSNSPFIGELNHEPRQRRKLTTDIDGFAVLRSALQGDSEEKKLKGFDSGKTGIAKQRDCSYRHQKYCHKCKNSDSLIECKGCPRAYHLTCLSELNLQKYKRSIQYTCPQHNCLTCHKNAHDAGGLLYRCSYCDVSYCEICLDWDKTTLLGNTLPELEELGLSDMNEQVYYIKCAKCTK